MPNEPVWLSRQVIIDTNKEVVATTGEPFAVLDDGKLQAAAARPQQIYGYESEDILDLATALLFGIARAHAFLQGNKRTAFLAAETFLNANGFTMEVDSVSLAELIIEIIEGKRPESDFTKELYYYLQPIEE
ncbi:type II toxin-antitoxin system death-on-curing family toxin [Mesorhizobium loti]|uniref:type II toxin-antitoxin system death-on-curing family toxin n=1 Tax=Rhizobium loti TaxID=381 RepID=UPI0006886F2A|nr:type II toxin-antitoxin system death-on-curing family toxin [Mesorhizobium loti]